MNVRKSFTLKLEKFTNQDLAAAQPVMAKRLTHNIVQNPMKLNDSSAQNKFRRKKLTKSESEKLLVSQLKKKFERNCMDIKNYFPRYKPSFVDGRCLAAKVM